MVEHSVGLVAHDRDKVKADRTLEALYLAPLRKRFEAGNGHVVPGLRTLILLVDIKSDGLRTYQALEVALAKHRPMLTEFSKEGIRTNAVTVIISGDRPREYMVAQEKRLAAMDGRLPDLAANPPLSSPSSLSGSPFRRSSASSSSTSCCGICARGACCRSSSTATASPP